MGKRHKVRKVRVPERHPGGQPGGATAPAVRTRAVPGWFRGAVLRSWASPDRRFRLRFTPTR